MNDNCDSAEEYPFESTAQGGFGAILGGVPLDMQNRL
jgi:hypothetical protein